MAARACVPVRFRAAGILISAAAVLLSAGGCAPYAQLPTDPQTGIRNLAKVSDDLYRGGQPDSEGFAALERMGIRTVVSLRTLDLDRPRLRGLGLRYYHISFKAAHPEDEDVVAFLKVVQDPANHPVFVHCKFGADRTGMMVALYRMMIEGRSRADAVAEMRAMGFNRGWDNLLAYVEGVDVGRLRARVVAARAPQVEVVR